MVKSIFLQDGEEIFVDDEDYERVNQHTWWKFYEGNSKFVCTQINNKKILLNNFIMDKKSVQKIYNSNFTKSNISTINVSRFRKPGRNQISKYKGVCFKKGYWEVNIYIDEDGEKIRKYVGNFKNEDDAGLAYNLAVDEYYSGQAYKNIIGEDNRISRKIYPKTKVKRRIKKTNKEGFRGIKKSRDNYITEGSFHGKKLYFGFFDNKYHAALAYNKCAIYLHGDDAILNDVPMTDELKAFIENWEIPKKILDLKKKHIQLSMCE